MTFDEAFQKLTEAFPDLYITLQYTRNPYKYDLKGYVEGKGWSGDCKSIGEVIMQLNHEEVEPATVGPEVP
jgi:hypothetical protein